ncbi:MAG TPA: hypothetical protein VIZ65_00200 [Cellvibrionaceae bacterium]
MEPIFYIGIGFLLLIAGYFLIKYFFIGVVFLFVWAAEQGFIGVAAYFACWFFLFPVMLVACIVTGAAIKWSN